MKRIFSAAEITSHQQMLQMTASVPLPEAADEAQT